MVRIRTGNSPRWFLSLLFVVFAWAGNFPPLFCGIVDFSPTLRYLAITRSGEYSLPIADFYRQGFAKVRRHSLP